MAKDVHTEHCCIVHGCKYGNGDDCTVMQKSHPQSSRCEYCHDEGIDPTKAAPETSIFEFKDGHYYKTTDTDDQNGTLMFVMGRLNDAQGEANCICDLWMWNLSSLSHVSSVQGTKKILVSQWTEVTKSEYDALKAKLK